MTYLALPRAEQLALQFGTPLWIYDAATSAARSSA